MPRSAVFTPETARSVMYPVLLTLGGSALLASVAFFAKKFFIGRGIGGIGRSSQWEVDSGGAGGGRRQVRTRSQLFLIMSRVIHYPTPHKLLKAMLSSDPSSQRLKHQRRKEILKAMKSSDFQNMYSTHI